MNEKLWIHKCKHAWKQIQKCMKTKYTDEFMDTNSKKFGHKWENAKMYGLQNVKVFMDTKCKDSWIWAWKQIYAKMQRNKCKERFMDIKTHKISGYKCKDTWMQNANIFMDTEMPRCMDTKCKDSRIPKCKDARIQIQKNFQIQMLQRCTWKQMQRFLDANAKKLRYKCKTILDTNVEKKCVDTNCKDSCI